LISLIGDDGKNNFSDLYFKQLRALAKTTLPAIFLTNGSGGKQDGIFTNSTVRGLFELHI
jgi:hypothetical protein